MKFYNYLNESELNLTAFNKMVKDCKPFLKDLKKSNFEFLYSGRKKTYENFDKRKVRKNRKPKDTPESIHKLLDKKFKENFGVKARSEGFFVTRSAEAVTGYGIPHYVFPVGKYKFIYSYKVVDLYGDLARRVYKIFGFGDINYFANVFSSSNAEIEIAGYTKDDWEKGMEKVTNDIIKYYKQSKKIPTGLFENSEIMLIADEVRLLYCNGEKKDMLKDWIDNVV